MICIGKINEEPRMFVGGGDWPEMLAQARPGEVVFAVPIQPVNRVIIVDKNGAYSLERYPYSVEDMKAWFWQKTKEYREQVISGGFESSHGPLDSDDVSQNRVGMAALAASTADSFSISWTLADNTAVPLGAEQMIELNTEVLDFVDGCHQAATSVRQQIEQVPAGPGAQAALEAIDIYAGYPAQALTPKPD